MKDVIFYLLEKNSMLENSLVVIEQLVCDITAENWRNGDRVIIFCENKQQAIRIDEALWVRPPGSFIPHSLSTEESKSKVPVEISWSKKHITNIYETFINLCINFSDFFTTFIKVIDFVPCEESLKQLARKRYKMYRAAGFNLKTVLWNNDGKDIQTKRY